MKLKQPDTPASVDEKPPAAGFVDLGLSDYRATYDLQVALVEKVKYGKSDDFFLVTEHPAVFTLGRKRGRAIGTLSVTT